MSCLFTQKNNARYYIIQISSFFSLLILQAWDIKQGHKLKLQQ